MMGACRSRGRGPARLRLPEGQRKHYVRQEDRSLSLPLPNWSPHTQKYDPHAHTLPLFAGSGAVEHGALWVWGRVQTSPSLLGCFHFPFL